MTPARRVRWSRTKPGASLVAGDPWTGTLVAIDPEEVTSERLEALAVLMPDGIREELHREFMDDPWGFWVSFVDRVGEDEAGRLWFS